MSTSSPGATLYATSLLTRHLSTRERTALASAVRQATDDLYDDKIGTQVRKEGMQRQMAKIANKVSQHLDDDARLNRWESRIRRLFWEAGETEFAHERLGMYLEDVYGRVKEAMSNTTLDSLNSARTLTRVLSAVVSISGVRCDTGIDLRIQQVDYEIDRLLEHFETSLENQQLNEPLREYYESLLDSYARHLRYMLTRPSLADNTEEILAFWEAVWRTVKVLQHLAALVPVFSNYTIAPLFGLDNLVKRCNLWQPPVPTWYFSPSRS